MNTGRLTLRGVRIEIDDARLVVERDGVEYVIEWETRSTSEEPDVERVASTLVEPIE